jgi:two-component system, cell cycle response regulator
LTAFIKGLEPYRIRRVTFPESHAILLRGNWKGESSREELIDLVKEDVYLYVSLSWLNSKVVEGITARPNRLEVEKLVGECSLDVVHDVVLSMVIMRAYRLGTCPRLDRDDFWSGSLARAVAAKHFGEKLGIDFSLRCFLSGLFCEFGRVIFGGAEPERYGDLIERSGESDVVLRQLEREAFGIDRDSVAWACLRDYGVSREVFGTLLSKSHRTRYPDASGGEIELVGPKVLRIATLLGEIISSDMAPRRVLWDDMVKARNELEISADDMNALGDRIVNDWWSWGDLMMFPTRTLPGFGELADWNERGVKAKRYNATGGKPLVARSLDSGLHILLVEDDRVVQLATRRKLERAGHHVAVANDGMEALAILRQSPPEVILSDWHMPGMDGLNLCRFVRSSEYGRRMFFILFTAEVDEAKIVRAYEVGIDDFIDKRSPLPLLLARISAARKFLLHWEHIDQDRRIIRMHCEVSRLQAAKMRHDSLTDTLTELPNRRYAMERLRDEWARSDRSGSDMSVVMMDIDFFKLVNDQHGHDVGDVVLKEVAFAIREVTRRGEAACRIGGEEFLIICSDTNLSAASKCAERVRVAIESRTIAAGSFDSNVTVSLGVAHKSAATQNLDALFKAADEAVYFAKENGRNRVITWPGMETVDKRADDFGRRSAG